MTLRQRRENRSGYLFLAPWLLGLLFITIGPMIASAYLSLTDYNVLSPPKWIGLENYIQMFTADPRFLQALKVTFVYVWVSVPLLLVFALFLAVMLNEGIKGLAFYRAVFYLPSLLGANVAIAILWRQVFGGQGILNGALSAVGIQGPNWIGNPDYAIVSLIALHLWTFGSAMVIFLAGLRQIPKDLYEAAAVDGGSRVRQFWSITLPMLTPVIFFNLVLAIISSFQAFTQAFIISKGTGGPVDSTLVYSLYLYIKGFKELDMGYASAMAWVLLIIIAIQTAFLFWLSRKWVFYGDA
jgi:ABC-type sugar transport systems, permease components